jgi:hypothetical protein
MKTELYSGLDVHKDCMATAVAGEGAYSVIKNDLHALEK